MKVDEELISESVRARNGQAETSYELAGDNGTTRARGLSVDRNQPFLPARGDDNLDDRARVGIRQSQAASQFVHALSHSADTHPNALRTQLNHLFLDSLSIIADCDHEVPFPFVQTHRSVARSGVPEDVGERLLDDPEDGGLQVWSETAQVEGIDLQVNFNSAALGKPFQVPAQR